MGFGRDRGRARARFALISRNFKHDSAQEEERGERGVLFSVPAVPEFKFPGICGIAFPKRE